MAPAPRNTRKTHPKAAPAGRGWMRTGGGMPGEVSSYVLGLGALAAAAAAAAVSWARAAPRAAPRSTALPTSYLSAYAVVAELAHRPSAFTQGLCIDDRGVMWESVGNYGHSAVHRVELGRRARAAAADEPAAAGAEDGARAVEAGDASERFELPASLFAEGIACLPGGRLLQLTWREGVVLDYETRPRLAHARARALGGEFRAAAAAGAGAPRRPREMWGAAYVPPATLGAGAARAAARAASGSGGAGAASAGGPGAASAGGGLVAVSNGSSFLVFVEAETLAVRRTVRVHDPRLGLWIEGLNELELVDSELWANVYPMYQRKASACVARVEPRTGEVLGWLDLSALADAQPEAVRRHPDHYVLNGIAYNASPAADADVGGSGAAGALRGGGQRELYVTGKHWDRLFQIELREPDTRRTEEEAVAHVRRACNLYLGAPYRPRA